MRRQELNEGKLAGNVRWVKSWIEQGLSREEAHKKAKIYTIHPSTVDDLYNQAKETNEGYKIMPPMDPKYVERKGLEGPFTTLSGKVVYYDPKAVAHKNLPELEKSTVESVFGSEVKVFTDIDEFRIFFDKLPISCNLLVMSSGNLGGFDIRAYSEKWVSEN